MSDSIRLTEVFYSLQGEANTVGLPTVFIRLTGCPLRCVYCDTAYAFTGGYVIDLEELCTQVQQYPTKYITITGGEPLAQPACLTLSKKLLDAGYYVAVETSGALDISKLDPRAIKVMDLKTPSSGEQQQNLYTNLDYLTAQDQIKFVLATEADYQWAVSQMLEYDLTQKCQVLFSPVQGQMSPKLLADKILQDQLQVRFQIQLHKYLWDDAQGK